jgi:hypothetical protein
MITHSSDELQEVAMGRQPIQIQPIGPQSEAAEEPPTQALLIEPPGEQLYECHDEQRLGYDVVDAVTRCAAFIPE